MKINLKQRLKGAVTGYKDAFFNAPVAMILCGLIGILAIIHSHGSLSREASDMVQRAVMVCILGIPLSILTVQMAGRIRNSILKVALWIATIAFLVLYYFLGIPSFEMKPITRTVGLTFTFIVSYVLYYSEANNLSHEKITLFVLKRLLFTGVYALVIWGGISFTFFAFSELMDIRLWDEAYFDFLFITLGFLIPAYFFYAFPRETTQEEQEISPFVTTMISYILIPVILAYTAVLYLYFIRLLVTFEWPEGMLGHLVFWYGLVSTAVMYFIRPFAKNKRITDLFYRYFPYVIIIPLIMMFISLGIRIKAYGVTEPRYAVGIIGLWIMLSVFLYLVKNRFKNINRWVLTGLIVVCLVSLMGPLSAYSTSVASQNRQFSLIEEKYGFLSRLETFNAQDMETNDRERVSNILRYFDQTHSLDDLKLPEHIDQNKLRSVFDFSFYPAQPYRYVNIDSKDTHPMDIKGYDYLLGMYANDFTILSKYGVEYSIKRENTHFVIYKGENEVYRKDLGEYIIDTYHKESQSQNGDQPKDYYSLVLPGSDLVYEDKTENFHIRFFVQSAYIRVFPDGAIEVENISHYTALKLIE